MSPAKRLSITRLDNWNGLLDWHFLGFGFTRLSGERAGSLSAWYGNDTVTHRNTPPPGAIQFILWCHANYASSTRGGAACCRQTSQLGLERLHTLYGHMYQRLALKCYLIVGCIFKRLWHMKSCGVATAHRQISTSSWNRMYYRTSHSGTRGQYCAEFVAMWLSFIVGWGRNRCVPVCTVYS